jgi:N-carbamoylputrescine amidase
VGREDKYTYYGRSVVFDPGGEPVAQAGAGEEVLLADCDLDQITQRRRAWQFYRERRPDTYGILTQMVP